MIVVIWQNKEIKNRVLEKCESKSIEKDFKLLDENKEKGPEKNERKLKRKNQTRWSGTKNRRENPFAVLLPC